jgi:hypothetical protein
MEGYPANPKQARFIASLNVRYWPLADTPQRNNY